jgi:hypothetical protein
MPIIQFIRLMYRFRRLAAMFVAAESGYKLYRSFRRRKSVS